MKILVFDDNPLHRKAAEVQLKDHDLTVVGTYDEAQKALVKNPEFDVVLTDLMVPASGESQFSDSPLIGQEMPLGTIIALLAIAQGVKMVAVVTDMNHHKHPASAALDCFSWLKKKSGVFCTNYNVLCGVDPETLEAVSDDFLNTPEGLQKYPVGPGGTRYKGFAYVKDWTKVLKMLCGKNEEED